MVHANESKGKVANPRIKTIRMTACLVTRRDKKMAPAITIDTVRSEKHGYPKIKFVGKHDSSNLETYVKIFDTSTDTTLI